MGLFIQRDEQRSELQERIAADLQAKAKARQEMDEKPKDAIEDSAYLQGTKRTTSLAWIWALIVIAAVAVIIYFIVRAYGG